MAQEIPLEILTDIFLNLLQITRDERNQRPYLIVSPLHLAAVCRYWKVVVESTPLYWTTVIFDTRMIWKSPNSFRKGLEDWLARTKDHLLDIYIRGQPTHYLDETLQAYSILRTTSPRWRHIELLDVDTSIADLMGWRNTRSLTFSERVEPPLESFSITRGTGLEALHPSLGYIPTLKTFVGEGCGFVFIYELLDHPETITSLTLRDLCGSISVQPLLLFRNLTTASFHIARTKWKEAGLGLSSAKHPSLRSLSVDADSWPYINCIIQCIRAPVLKELRLCMDEPAEGSFMPLILTFIQESACNLTVLSLPVPVGPDNMSLVSLLLKQPNINELYLRKVAHAIISRPTVSDGMFLAPLHPDAAIIPSYLPHLRILVYEGNLHASSVRFLDALISRCMHEPSASVDAPRPADTNTLIARLEYAEIRSDWPRIVVGEDDGTEGAGLMEKVRTLEAQGRLRLINAIRDKAKLQELT